MPGTVLGPEYTAVNKADENLCLCGNSVSSDLDSQALKYSRQGAWRAQRPWGHEEQEASVPALQRAEGRGGDKGVRHGVWLCRASWVSWGLGLLPHVTWEATRGFWVEKWHDLTYVLVKHLTSVCNTLKGTRTEAGRQISKLPGNLRVRLQFSPVSSFWPDRNCWFSVVYVPYLVHGNSSFIIASVNTVNAVATSLPLPKLQTNLSLAL